LTIAPEVVAVVELVRPSEMEVALTWMNVDAIGFAVR
jgi:hypothetical protein